MKLDLGVDPQRTIVGLVMFGIGAVAEVYVVLHITSVSFWFAFAAPLILGLGGGTLLGQWSKTKRLRRAARDWADAHPGEDPDELAPEPPKHRGVPQHEEPQRRAAGPEDDPAWTTYTRQWLGKPENPTDESGGMGDHD